MTLASQERRTWSSVASFLPSWRGTHQVKFGVQFEHAPYKQDYDSLGHGDFIARYRNGVPDSVLVYNTPVKTSLDQFEFAAFVQDSWTLDRRLTVNAGIRFERHVGSLNEQSAPAGQFVGAGSFEARPASSSGTTWCRACRWPTTSSATAGRSSRPASASSRSARARR